jgi:hypothetical protein
LIEGCQRDLPRAQRQQGQRCDQMLGFIRDGDADD